MKRLLLSLTLMVAVLGAQAQVYIGGSLGLDVVSTHVDGSETTTRQTTFGVMPEIGGRINKTWSAGVTMGYGISKQDGIKLETYRFTPYVRAVFARAGIVDFFGELTAGYVHMFLDDEDSLFKDDDGLSGMLAALRPGMAINFSRRFALVARTNLLQYEYWDGLRVTNFSLNKGFDVGVQVTF